jgi:hypothetical protein
MLIDFKQQQIEKFQCVIQKLWEYPEQYLDFERVSDFYQASWLQDLPSNAQYSVSGLDDGAENFEVIISVYQHVLRISCDDKITMRYIIRGITCMF